MADGDTKRDLLARVPLFSKLRPHDLDRLERLADEIDVPAGKVLIRQGEPGDEFFVIAEGSVRVERDGRLVATRGPGTFVGEIALVDEGPRSATVTCETPCRLIVLGHREFHSLMDAQPEIERAVLRALAERVRQLEPAAAE